MFPTLSRVIPGYLWTKRYTRGSPNSGKCATKLEFVNYSSKCLAYQVNVNSTAGQPNFGNVVAGDVVARVNKKGYFATIVPELLVRGSIVQAGLIIVEIIT